MADDHRNTAILGQAIGRKARASSEMVSAEPTTLTGDVERVTFENDDTGFRVLRVRAELAGKQPSSVVVVGSFQAVGPGATIRATGHWVKDPRHGDQFKADSVVAVAPTTIAGLEKYLGSGVFPGIGPALAKRIVDKFGLQSLAVLDSAPERLSEVQGLGDHRAGQIREAWTRQRGVSNVMLFLQQHGESPGLAARICKHYGDRALNVVQRSPYRLALEVRGIGFKTADRLARSVGIAEDHPERAQAGVIHQLGSFAEQGHVFVSTDTLIRATCEMLALEVGLIESAISSLHTAGRVVVEADAVYLARLHRAESELARDLSELGRARCEPIARFEQVVASVESELGIELAPEQRHAINSAATCKVVVVTGGPGVGKTTIVRAILAVFRKARLKVRLAAPTGRAAKRMSEATGTEATTIHRLLEYEPRTRTFQRADDNPVEADAVIVDESSMIDLPLAAALLCGLPPAARLVIVGDVDQLPSVGPGAILRDVIESGTIPVVRLERVYRQAGESRIVVNAHGILRGVVPESSNLDDPGADFFIVQRRDPEQAADTVRELVTERIPRRFGLDPKLDVQVLAPMHRGPTGTGALNQRLQAALNPDTPGIEWRGQTFRTGDKIMQTRNDYERETFNGDIGTVLEVSVKDRLLRARFDDRVIEYSESDLEALVLAYAITIHKSQGSEYPAIVLPLLTTHFVMLSRNLLYTAVTRAKRLCVLVADPRALSLALAETRKEERMTRLEQRLREALQR